MDGTQDSGPGKLWDRLSFGDQQELILADDESNDESQLVTNEEVMKKLVRWL